MNREIKFKMWDNSEKQMVSNYGLMLRSINGIIELEQKDIIFLQFTGLKDKNRKEIYEGDIVMYSDPLLDKYIQLVEYGEKHAGFTIIEGGKYTEIIGNIYENPELLNPKI